VSGDRGSGTIFFTWCSLRCIFCQNAAISQHGHGTELNDEQLAGAMLELQGRGCHNINLVSPTHYAPQIATAVATARRNGLCLPIVYNTHGYDSADALSCMDGIVDIYLVDMKYARSDVAVELSGVRGYREANREALGEMFSQVGHLQVDPVSGLAIRGMLVRILLLPDGMEGAQASLSFLRNRFSTETAVSLMSQYAPVHLAEKRPPLDRVLRSGEYEETVAFAHRLGFRRLWLQEMSASTVGIPDFSATNPFEF
jgi:putative pyruvate formate lyase activating enzyme